MNRKQKVIFLAGLFTGRGCICVNKSHKGFLSFRIKFSSKSEAFAKQLSDLLTDLEIPNITSKTQDSIQVWILSIPAIQKFIKLVQPYLKLKSDELLKLRVAMKCYDGILAIRFKKRQEGIKTTSEKIQPALDTLAKTFLKRK